MTKDNILQKQIGKQIKRYRKKANLSQEQLAEKIGIATNSLSNIETGNSFMTSKTLEKLLMIFDISAKELFDFSDAYVNIPNKKDLILSYLEEIKDNESKINLVYIFLKALI